MRQYLDRTRGLCGKILINDKVQPSLLEVLPRVRRQVMADNMHLTRGLGALERIHAAAHGFVGHINAAQARVITHLLQHAVVGQLILLDAFDDLRVDRAAKNLMDVVEKAAHAQAVCGKLAVAGHDQHLRARDIGREQPRRRSRI